MTGVTVNNNNYNNNDNNNNNNNKSNSLTLDEMFRYFVDVFCGLFCSFCC